MKRKNPLRINRPKLSDTTFVTLEVTQVVKFFSWIFGYKKRKRQQKINELTEERRLLHIEHHHRLSKDRFRG